jgi:alkylhydroperoxidase family enzyme
MRETLAAFRPTAAGRGRASGTGDGARREPGNLICTFACYPELARAYLAFNAHVQYATTLPARQRELVILRVAVRTKSEYEWAQHVPMGADVGLTPEELSDIVAGPGSPAWESLDQSVLYAVDELLDCASVSNATWANLARHWEERQIMDLVFTVGAYQTLAMALRSFEIEPDDEIVPNLPTTTGAWNRNIRDECASEPSKATM